VTEKKIIHQIGNQKVTGMYGCFDVAAIHRNVENVKKDIEAIEQAGNIDLSIEDALVKIESVLNSLTLKDFMWFNIQLQELINTRSRMLLGEYPVEEIKTKTNEEVQKIFEEVETISKSLEDLKEQLERLKK
jgi:seryl-tRNA synthetase